MPAGIMPDHPQVLADGSPVKGILHARFVYGPNGYTEVASSEMVRRYFGNDDGTVDKEVHGGGATTRTYDSLGFVTAIGDATGQVTTLERDTRGRLLRATDRLGRVRAIARSSEGDPVEEVDPTGAVIRRLYDRNGNLLSEIAPDGATWAYEYDAGRLA